MMWKSILEEEFEKDYFKEIASFIAKEYKNRTIFPPKKYIFNAFNLTSPKKIRVVILGQDVYHGKGQAHGLAFSVPKNISIPPSLRNIYKELKSDLNIDLSAHGNLSSWAKQGVFLLNCSLTVREREPGSHMETWKPFISNIIKRLNDLEQPIVFMLWGNFARSKKALITNDKHLLLEASHPSFFSCAKFFGCKHFSQANAFLKKNGQSEIDWFIK